MATRRALRKQHIVQRAGSNDERSSYWLVHAYCHRRHPTGPTRQESSDEHQPQQNPQPPVGLA